MENISLFERIRVVYADLSKQQKIVADAILDHYKETVFLNAKELSEKIGVSSATIVRFAQAIHYDGYPDLAKELRQHFFEGNSPMVKLWESFIGPSDRFETFKQVMELDQENIRLLDKQTTPQALSNALELLLHSKKWSSSGGERLFRRFITRDFCSVSSTKNSTSSTPAAMTPLKGLARSRQRTASLPFPSTAISNVPTTSQPIATRKGFPYSGSRTTPGPPSLSAAPMRFSHPTRRLSILIYPPWSSSTH